MLARLAVLFALILAAPAFAAPGDLQLIDLTPAFTAAWTKTAELPDAGRAAAFRAEFAKSLPGFYSAERVGAAPEKYDARLLTRLKQFPEQRAQIEAVSARFATMFAPARTSFESRFGPMRGYPPIYLVHSLGEFDGGTRELSGRPVLLFGADMIARLHMTHDIQPFFHHELFHLYHQRTFRECEAVWCGLWTEGLAVYVARSLNPKATDEDLLLTFPEPLRPAVDRNRAAAVCAVVQRLDSRDETAMRALFSDGRLGPGLPPRFGYYVGYLAAAEMGRSASLKALSAMPAAEVRPRLEAALRKLATCP